MNSITAKDIKKAGLALALPAIVFILIYALAPQRFGFYNLPILLQQAIAPAILAWGLCFQLKVGHWDFSVGAVFLLSAIVGGNLALMLGLGVIGTIILCSMVGLVLGVITGGIYTALKIPSIIVTIGMMLILESISLKVFRGRVFFPSEMTYLGKFPYNVIVGLVIFAITYIMYNYLILGFQVRAVGNSPPIAKLCGINTNKVKFMCFGIAGLYSGFYAFMSIGLTGYVRSTTNMQSMGIIFSAIITAFIALSLERIVNLIIGVYIGSVTIQMVKVGMIAINLPAILQEVIIAVFLLVIMGWSLNSDVIKKSILRLKIRKTSTTIK